MRGIAPLVLSERMMSLRRVLWFGLAALTLSSAALAGDKTTAVWADGHTSPISDEQLVGNTTAAPGAPYPEEAQKNKTTGSGIYELRIDKAATTAFKKWRFKPGVFQSVRVPVSWSVNPVR